MTQELLLTNTAIRNMPDSELERLRDEFTWNMQVQSSFQALLNNRKVCDELRRRGLYR